MYNYLVKIQYLGYKIQGLQKQKNNENTIIGILSKSLLKVNPHFEFKILGMSRTDSQVSALCNYLLLKINSEVSLQEINLHLPLEIRILSIEGKDKNFRIINSAKEKTYHYHFSFNERPHPMMAPLISHFNENLNIERMEKATKLFLGEHNFYSFCYRPKNKIEEYKRSINSIKIEKNEIYKTSFDQNTTYFLEVKGERFFRYQIRLIMGALLNIGTGKMKEEDVIKFLENPKEGERFPFIAPSNGLILVDIKF